MGDMYCTQSMNRYVKCIKSFILFLLNSDCICIYHCVSFHFAYRLSTDSWWPLGLMRRPVAAHLLGLWVRIPTGSGMFVFCDCCVFYRYRPVRRADPSSRGVLPSVHVSMCVNRRNKYTLLIQ